VNEMANKIIALLRHKPLKEMLAEHSLREIEKLTWESQAEKILKIYEEVLKRGA